MSAATRSRARTSQSFVLQSAEAPLTAARLLRMCDSTRRDLAQHLMGEQGLGAGYDGLSVDWSAIDAVQAGEVVTATALLRAVGRGGHLVEYIVTVSDCSLRGQGRCTDLIRATGWTLPSLRPAVPRSRSVKPQAVAGRESGASFAIDIVEAVWGSK